MGYQIGLAEKRRIFLKEKLNGLLPKIIDPDVEKVILFGSLAKDLLSKSSDIDIIVVKKTNKKFFDRIDEIYDQIKPDIALDLLVYTPEEFHELQDSSSFLKEALRNGRILYDKERK